MKALCLQLSVAVCAILSIQNLSAQLSITCPSPDLFNYECIDDVPAQTGDSIGFFSLDGAAINGLVGSLNITYSEDISPDQTGCPGSPLSIMRTFTFEDSEGSTEIIECTITHLVERPVDADVVTCEDVTINLDETGAATLSSEEITYAPTLICGGDITISSLQVSDFFCNNTFDSPISNSLLFINDCGEELACTFGVTVLDTFPPEITCPSNILIDLDPCVCESAVTFEDPIASDECAAGTSLIIDRIDTTGLNSGDFFPEGLTVLTFAAEDLSGNTSICNLQVRLSSSDPGSLFCKGSQNISLDENCSAVVTPQMTISEPACDIDSYRIVLSDLQGNLLPSDTITAEYLGEVVVATSYYECYDNSCQVQFNVEDKMPPMINCSDMTISCSDFIAFPLPIISDNCGTFSPVLLNQVPLDVGCDSVDIDKIITRTYGVSDENGDIVETCDQRLSIMKFDISEVMAPDVVVTVACDSLMILDENGNPDPAETGAPTLNGLELYPQADIYCNVSLTYDDMEFPGNGCGKMLLRTWTVVNWYCGDDGMVTFKQSIAVIDTIAPEVTVSDDITISSAMLSCETSYTIPPPVLSDNCQDDIKVDIIYPGGIAFDTNTYTVELGLGENEITYRVDDRCGNMSLTSYTVTVEDMVEPVAICESGMSFSLDGNGMAILTAQTFDNGSIEECSDATLEIARMTSNCGEDDDLIFGSQVTLCCADIGQEVMVILRVTDDAGNTSQCMTAIQVVDETGPSFLTGLPDITISNDYPIDLSDLSPFGVVEQNVVFPADITLSANVLEFSGPNINAVVMDNCSTNTIDENYEADISMCQTGSIERTFIVADEFGNADTIFQTINIIAESVFALDDITFPNDTTIMDVCSPVLDGQILGSFPIYDDTFSSMVSHTNEDDTLSYSSDACFTVERVWYVSDWCNRPDGLTFATYIDTQLITIIDTEAPVISSTCSDSTICSFVSACGPHPIDISATATDNCTITDSLEWTFLIDYADDRADSLGLGSNINTSLPVGINVITWMVDDGCGNTDECSFNFTIESCLNPQPLCFLGQEFFIEPIDTTGDDIADLNGVRITADMIDAGSSHPCAKDVSVSFSEDLSDTVRIFTCDTLGTVPLMLFATDEEGRFDFCNASISVRDTSSEIYCGMSMVTGIVFGNEVDFVSGVDVSLEGAEMMTTTDEHGFFAFPEMSPGGEYAVVPHKDDVARNGVSSADLVLIQRHILELQTFESPYKRIAADVNQSGHISAADLIAIRKLILGISGGFANDKTWTFIPGDHVFVDPEDPWAGPIPEEYNIYELAGQNDLDFIGVKLGDVNESVEMSTFFSTTRSMEELDFKIEGKKLEVFASRDMKLAALLSSITIQDKVLESIEHFLPKLVLNHHLSEEGILNLLLTSPEDVEVRKGEKIFAVEFSSKLDEKVLGSLEFNSDASEIAYASGLSTKVNYRFLSDFPSVILKQNIPNPWVDETSFSVIMPADEVAVFRILDMSGREVLKRNVSLMKGENSIKLKEAEMPTIGGMYFYELGTSFGVESRKMMLLAH